MTARPLFVMVFIFAGCRTAFHDDMPLPDSPRRQAHEARDEVRQELIETLTLEKALQFARESNLDLNALVHDVRAAQGRELQSGLRPNPVLELLNETIPEKFSDGEQVIGLTQPFSLTRRFEASRIRAAAETDIARLGYTMKERAILAEVRNLFYAALFYQEKVRTWKQIHSGQQEVRDLVKELYKEGEIAEWEYLKSEDAQIQTWAESRRVEQEEASVQRALAVLLGRPAPFWKKIDGDLTRVQPVPSQEDLRQVMRARHAELQMAEAEIDRAVKSLAEAEAAAVPDISVIGRYRRIGEEKDNHYDLGIELPLPVFDRNQGRIAEVRAQISAAQLRKEALLKQLDGQLTSAWNEYQSHLQILEKYDKEVLPNTEKVLEQARLLYVEGETSQLELLDAQRTYATVRQEYLENVLKLQQLSTRLLVLSGEPLQ